MQLHQLPDPGMVNNLVADPLYPHKSTPFKPPPRAHLRDAELMVTYERSQQGGDALVVDLRGGECVYVCVGGRINRVDLDDAPTAFSR